MSLPIRFSRVAKLGILLAVGSVIPWLLLLVLPFLPLSLTEQAIAAAGLLVLAEVMFWVGGYLQGMRWSVASGRSLTQKPYGSAWSVTSGECGAIIKELGHE